jgi:mycoredoxin-dependent peroxiredoxin
MSVEVGQQAPDFTLKDQNGAEVSLSSYRGQKNVLLVFYPLAFSGICQGELCAIRDDLPRFANESVQVLSVSIDSVFVHKAWAEREGYEFPLLSDFWPHGEVAKAYGVFNDETGFAVRGTFLIDTDGVVQWKVVNAPGEARDQAEYVKALEAVGA